MRVFKGAQFAKFCRKARIDDISLCDAVRRAEHGLIDADLGGGVVKQRLARKGAGKSGGYRIVLLFRSGKRAVFVFGFAKNDRPNLDAREEDAFRSAAKLVLSFSDDEMDLEVAAGRVLELKYDG